MTAKQLVLIVEPDRRQREAMASAVGESFETLLAEDGQAGLRQFFSSHPDFVAVSLDATGLDAWDLIERIRALAETPVVVTAAEASVAALQRAFDLRVDGFLVKPFAAKELLVRLNAIRSRLSGESDQQRWVYRRNGLVVDWRSCEVFVNGENVSLTSTEYRLLSYLIEHRGWVLSHDQILSEVWGPEYVGEKDRVKLYVWYLRQKIEHEPATPKLIVTKRGLGYTFVG